MGCVGGIELDEQRSDLLTGRTPTGRKVEQYMVFSIQIGCRGLPVVTVIDRPIEHLRQVGVMRGAIIQAVPRPTQAPYHTKEDEEMF
jgi:hypothetical protein